MRRSLPSFPIFLLAAVAVCSVAAYETPEHKQGAVAPKERNDRATVETRLTELFDLCKRGEVGEATAYFVYRGEDKSREWKDTFRASDPLEKAAAGELCRRITGYLDESQAYVFGEVKVKRESEGVWHALEVSFQGEGQSRKVIFAFLKIKGQYAIGDIDE